MRVRSVRKIQLNTPVPVYDLTVPETENFGLAAGPVVHNSKDTSDALAGSLYSLSQSSVYNDPLPMLTSGSGLPYLPGITVPMDGAQAAGLPLGVAPVSGSGGSVGFPGGMLPPFLLSRGGGYGDGG